MNPNALIARRKGSHSVLTLRFKHVPNALNELELMLLLSTMAGSAGWRYAITRHKKYVPYLSTATVHLATISICRSIYFGGLYLRNASNFRGYISSYIVLFLLLYGSK